MVLGPCVLSPAPFRWVHASVTVEGQDEMRLCRDGCSAPLATQVSHSRWDARVRRDVKEDYGTLQVTLH